MGFEAVISEVIVNFSLASILLISLIWIRKLWH